MFTRLRLILLQFLIMLDQSLQTFIFGAYYIVFGGPCPSADETISSIVGRKSEEGKRWAKIAEYCINGLFSALGQKDHCRRSIEILGGYKYPE